MKKFWIQFYFVILCGFLFIGCIFFLRFNHKDTLIYHIPEEANTYLHTNKTNFKKLPEEFQKDLFFWLETNSSLSKENWKSIVQNIDDEFAFFSLNKQFFILTTNNNNLSTFQKNKNINTFNFEEYTITPRINVNNLNWQKKSWISKIKNNLSFSPFTLYLKDQTVLNIPLENPHQKTLTPIIGTINYNNKLEINLKGEKIGLTKLKEQKTPEITDDVAFYFHGEISETLKKQETKYSHENLLFLIAHKLNDPIEITGFLNQNFQIKTTDHNNLKSIKQDIIILLARIFPIQQKKVLPDNSVATHYIAKTEDWTFEQTNNNTQQIATSQEIPFNISITSENQTNIIKREYVQETNNTSSSIKTKCSLKNTNIYINPSSWDYKANFNNIVIKSSNPSKISICID